MDKSREQFELFFKRDYHPDKTGPYIKDVAFFFWQASRAAIEVDLPALCGDGENDTEYTIGLNDGISQSERAIKSLGLKVKP